jgi:hypothetical protein
MGSRPFVMMIALLPLDSHWETLLSDCSAWARVNQHPRWYLHFFECRSRPLSGRPENVRFELRDPEILL